MNIYEVIFLASHGKRDSEDTIYLVRASDFRTAVEHVQHNTSPSDHNGVNAPQAHAVYEVGVDLSPYADSNHPCTLRGPYFAFAVNRGWKAWRRKMEGADYTNEWEAEK
jgi:hypothetical protein